MVLKTSDIAAVYGKVAENFNKIGKQILGSARVPRAGFGVAPKRTFL
jgi:hypothetical protein